MSEYCEKFRQVEAQMYDMAFLDRLGNFLAELPQEGALHIRNAVGDTKEMEVVYRLARQWATTSVPLSSHDCFILADHIQRPRAQNRKRERRRRKLRTRIRQRKNLTQMTNSMFCISTRPTWTKLLVFDVVKVVISQGTVKENIRRRRRRHLAILVKSLATLRMPSFTLRNMQNTPVTRRNGTPRTTITTMTLHIRPASPLLLAQNQNQIMSAGGLGRSSIGTTRGCFASSQPSTYFYRPSTYVIRPVFD